MKYLARITSIASWVKENTQLVIKKDEFDVWAEVDSLSLVDELEDMNIVASRIKGLLL